MSFIIDQDNKSVKHSNDLSMARYSLGLDEQRIIALAIAKSNTSNNMNRTQTIKASEFATAFNLSHSSAYKQLKNAANSLYNNSIKFMNDEAELRWISSKAIYKQGEGAVEFSFTPEIMEHINGLKENYTWYEISRISSMTSVYAIRIYELMMSWRGTGRFTITIDELREKLKIEDKYPAFGAFKKLILLPAIEQIKEHAGYFCQMHFLKEGRKFHSITFVFFENHDHKSGIDIPKLD